MRCERAQQWMTAAVDGELSPRRRRALDRHLAGCEACRYELVTTERMLAAVAALPGEAEVPAHVEQATLRRVRLLAAEEAEGTRARGWWQGLRLPAFVVATAAVLALAVGIVREAGPPTSGNGAPEQVAGAPATAGAVAEAESVDRMVATAPPSEPPAELAARPDLFVELPILRNLEKLQNFEAIETTTLDDQPAVPGEAGERSSG